MLARHSVVCAGMIWAALITTAPLAAVTAADPCALLTSAEVKNAVGVDMGTGKSLASKACQWRQPVKPGAPGAIVDVTVLSEAGFHIGESPAAASRFTITPVAGLGDEAYYAEAPTGELATLRVRKGAEAFAVRVWGAGVAPGDVKPKEKVLAALIIKRF